MRHPVQLLAARVLQGLGAAAMITLTLAFVGETVPKARTGSAMGLLATMSAVGTALGLTLGGVLLASLGWRVIFFVFVPLGLLAFGLAWRTLPHDRPQAAAGRARVDGLGTLLLAATLAAYALALTWGRGSFGRLNGVLLLTALAGLGLLVRVEARAASPLIRLTLLRDPLLRTSLATGALVATVMMTTLVVGPFYLARGLGLATAQLGLVMSVGPIAAALSGAPAGRLADRFGALRIGLIGLAAVAVGTGLLALLPARFGIAGYISPLVLLTVGYALFQTANNTAVMADVQPDQRGLVSGVLNLSRNLGLITGASAMGAVFAWGSATSDVATGLRITFAVATVLTALSLALALRAYFTSVRN